MNPNIANPHNNQVTENASPSQRDLLILRYLADEMDDIFTPAGSFVCPKCQGIGKHGSVMMYVKQHTRLSIGQSETTGGGDTYQRSKVLSTGSFSFSSFTRSVSIDAPLLAYELMPPSGPEEPKKPKLDGNIKGELIYIGIDFLLVILAAITQNIVLYMISAIGGLLASWFIFWIIVELIAYSAKMPIYNLNLVKYQEKLVPYIRKMSIWSKLQVCFDDGVVYNPDTGQAVPTKYTEQLYSL